MSQSMGMAEFFAMEATEYLDRLDALLSAPKPPEFDELLRLAPSASAGGRGMRGPARSRSVPSTG
jgi:hypothetical protein